MQPSLDVFALPELVTNIYRYDISLCIDVLRATTTMVTALAHGAERILPFLTVEETLAARTKMLDADPQMAGRILLGGERKGVLIDGFDLGNSPDSYTEEQVKDKTILFTTTNGTKAVRSGWGKVYPVSFLNAAAVVQRILPEQRGKSIAIICAGTCGEFTQEDMLLAGYLTEEILLSARRNSVRPEEDYLRNVQAEEVLDVWQKEFSLRTDLGPRSGGRFRIALEKYLRSSQGGRNLLGIGLDKDIADAARIDSLSLVAEYRDKMVRISSLS